MAENTAPRRETPRIEADDLTSDEPSASYWKKLAETYQENINNYLEEKTRLEDQIYNLQEENRTCKEMLNESRILVSQLQEILRAEQNGSDEITEEAVQNN